MQRRRRIAYVIGVGALAVLMFLPSIGDAAAPGVTTHEVPNPTVLSYPTTPENRYAMAGGCYAIRSGTQYITRGGSGFRADAATISAAEPFTFQATELGQYLLFGTQKDFLAASEGPVGTAVYAATQSLPGQIAGGVALEQTDVAARTIANSPANVARGLYVVAAPQPSELADWAIDASGSGFSIVLPATNQALQSSGGDLFLVAQNAGSTFTLELTTGCAAYPEIEVNVDGPVTGGQTSFQETRGYLDAHLHMMAYEFLGGRARCGRPWHRYGAPYALVDCPDHAPGGQGAVLEMVLSGGNPASGHNTSGWPSFEGWPKYGSLTHEQVYYKWLERSWRGGLRMFVNLLVDNNQLCKIYPFKRNSCNEMDGVRLQAARINELQNYIDAQSGGPGKGWFRIVTDPFQARSIINQGKLAVVLGIEVSVPLDCGITLDVAHCDLSKIENGLDEVYALGVRQMELGNKFDNAFTGITGDGGATGIVVNQGNKGDTGRYWQMETCKQEEIAEAHDKQQMNIHDDQPGNSPFRAFTGRDTLVGGVLSLFGSTGGTQIYGPGPHCNIMGLTPFGAAMIRGMAQRHMIFDPDHMSSRARTAALDLLDTLNYSGVMSSHGWADDTIYPKIYELGGTVTPHAGGSAGFVGKWNQHKGWADPRFPFGLGFGSDMNGFSTQGGPRANNALNKVEYPFTGFGGVQVYAQKSGTHTYDINTEGVAHHGLYPDWVEDLRKIAGQDIVDDLAKGVEAYLQTWERALGIAGNACRSDVFDLTEAKINALQIGMTPAEVLEEIGQPNTRVGATHTFCVEGGKTATVTFSNGGALTSTAIA